MLKHWSYAFVVESWIPHDPFGGAQTPGSNVRSVKHCTAMRTLKQQAKNGTKKSLFVSSLMLTWCEFAMVSSHFWKTVSINTGVGCSVACLFSVEIVKEDRCSPSSYFHLFLPMCDLHPSTRKTKTVAELVKSRYLNYFLPLLPQALCSPNWIS